MILKEIVILAGGFGTRLQGVVPDLPKPLAPVRSKPFLFYLLEFWLSQGIDKFILAVGYKHEMIIEQIRASKFSDHVSFSIEKEPLDTGGAILKALTFIKQKNFIVQNGDTFVPINLNSIVSAYKRFKNITLFLAMVPGNDVKRYKFLKIDNKGIVSEENKFYKAGINSGLYVFNKEKLLRFNYNLGQRISFEKQILNDIISKKECAGHLFDTPFLDIGVPEDYNKAQFILP